MEWIQRGRWKRVKSCGGGGGISRILDNGKKKDS